MCIFWQHLKEQYSANWIPKELAKLTFKDGFDELKIEFSSDDFGSAAKIKQCDVKVRM